MSTLIREHDYIGLSEIPVKMEKISDKSNISGAGDSPASSSPSSQLSSIEEKPKSTSLNLKETELRLGLPGSQSPDRSSSTKPNTVPVTVSLFGKDIDGNNGFSINPLKNPVSGAKRGFSDAIDEGNNGNWDLTMNGKSKVDSSKGGVFIGLMENNKSVVNNLKNSVTKEVGGVVAQSPKQAQSSAPAAKAQVVGWPPIRSYRKNTMASNLSKNNDEEGDDEKSGGSCCLYVKVGMDGAPYLRKVDLKTYGNYLEFSNALEKMFSCFTIGQCGANGLPRDGLNLNDSKLMDLLHGSDYVLTYEDKDGDWMLVGDVPWQMFTDTCRRLRIMKGSEAIGLAPRAMEKSKNRS